MESSAANELKEPGVIDESIIYNAIIEQGPKNEEGRLFKEQGIDYKEITHLRLEFLDIYKIDHLWMMTGLTKLQLCNNIIEEIENLEMLTELKELDLSFNNIQKIKNLDTLTKLEVLTLFENKIEILENLDHLKKLTILSIGNNQITEFDNVIYLRGFDSLKSLNMAGNPICEGKNFLSQVIAYLPQLVYYEYKMIRRAQRDEARGMYMGDLIKLEREEGRLNEIKLAKQKEEEQEKINENAFVEGLRGSGLFTQLFENDSDGKTLLLMGDSVTEIYLEYKKSFCEVTNEIIRLGLEQADIRKAEMDEYESAIKKATEASYSESRKIVENFLEVKQTIFDEIRTFLEKEEEEEEEEEDAIAELSQAFQGIIENFHDLCLRTWNALMKRELHFYESCEEVNSNYERNLSEMVNQFVEQAQSYFTQLRQFQGAFNENITDAANKFFTSYTVATTGGSPPPKDMSVPADLAQMMQDREVLMNGLATSHDLHMLVIDQREDKLVSRVRGWLANLVDNVVRAEIQRNRDTVTEINHFLDSQRAELDELISSPLGLLLLPKNMQNDLNSSL